MSDHDSDTLRCGGTGMVAYWDGSAYAGEMCRGCIDCEGPDEAPVCPEHGTMVADDEMGRSWHCAGCVRSGGPAGGA